MCDFGADLWQGESHPKDGQCKFVVVFSDGSIWIPKAAMFSYLPGLVNKQFAIENGQL